MVFSVINGQMKIKDEDIIEGIRNQDSKILNYVYKAYYALIKELVLHNSGKKHDVLDVYQESIVVLYRNINRGVVIDCSLSTYLYAIAKKLWLNELRRRRRSSEYFTDSFDQISGSDETALELSSRYLLYKRHLKNLSESCQKLLKMLFDGEPVEKILQVMDAKNEHYLRRKKYKCKERLVKSIRQEEGLI